jgi:hypothetical protein
MRWIAILILLPLLCVGQSIQISRRAALIAAQAVPVAAGGGVCTVSGTLQQTTDNDYWQSIAGGPLTQKIKLTDLGGQAVCKIELKMQWSTATAVVHVELRPNQDGTGTQIGANSSSVSITMAGYNPAAFATFTFASPITPGSDFYILLKNEDANESNWRMSTSDTYANGSAYSFGADRPGNDFCFKVWTQ